MTADALATSAASASAGMVLTSRIFHLQPIRRVKMIFIFHFLMDFTDDTDIGSGVVLVPYGPSHRDHSVYAPSQ